MLHLRAESIDSMLHILQLPLILRSFIGRVLLHLLLLLSHQLLLLLCELLLLLRQLLLLLRELLLLLREQPLLFSQLLPLKLLLIALALR
jgi:hypothetical protein